MVPLVGDHGFPRSMLRDALRSAVHSQSFHSDWVYKSEMGVHCCVFAVQIDHKQDEAARQINAARPVASWVDVVVKGCYTGKAGSVVGVLVAGTGVAQTRCCDEVVAGTYFRVVQVNVMAVSMVSLVSIVFVSTQ